MLQIPCTLDGGLEKDDGLEKNGGLEKSTLSGPLLTILLYMFPPVTGSITR